MGEFVFMAHQLILNRPKIARAIYTPYKQPNNGSKATEKEQGWQTKNRIITEKYVQNIKSEEKRRYKSNGSV